MSRPTMDHLHLGLTAEELRDKPYADFWDPHLAPLPDHAREAVLRGPVAPPLLPRLEEAPTMLQAGHRELENGLSFGEDGEMRLAILTAMPDTSPEMVDWWFGWHSDETQRYKLWHPQAHVHASWESPPPPDAMGRHRYVHRTSFVAEYLGSELGRYAIQFIPPSELGLDETLLADDSVQTAVCARVGFADYPINFGYLLHHVRRVEGGSEMRSRFWVGGSISGGRDGNVAGGLAAGVGRLVKKPTVPDGLNLLVHCSQEMTHLAAFLPRLYRRLGAVPQARTA